jgi:DNA-binding transcriptional ArsR family regulator
MDRRSAVLALAALGFETRLEAVQLLSAAGDDGLPAGEIARRLGIPQNTLSDHLRSLAQADILTAERKSRSIIYRVNSRTLNEVASFLASI